MATEETNVLNIELLLQVMQRTQPIYLASATGELAFANEAYRALASAIAPSEVSANDTERALPARHREIVANVVASGAPVVRVEHYLAADGPRTLRGVHTPVFDADKRVIAVSGGFSDAAAAIGDAADAPPADERRYQDFARASTDWIWETDQKGRLTFISDRIALAVGIPSHRLQGQYLSDLCRHAGDDALASPVLERQRELVPFRNALVGIRTAAGERRLCHVSGVPTFDDDGRFTGYRGTGTDVTRSLQASETLKESNRELETTLGELHRKNLELDQALAETMTATKAKDSFLASMSHELRTPLNAILGFAEIMQLGLFGSLNEQYTGYAGDIIGAGRHLLRLVDDILDIARIESDRLPLTEEALSAQGVIADVSALIRNNASKRQLEFDPPPTRPDYMLRGDRTRIMQILTNLLSNAVKYTPPGGRVGVSLGVTDDWPGMVEITVWDTGPGIAPDLQDQIFETFNRGERDSLEHVEEGVGIGLSLARRLARLMGGDVRLQSKLGQGSRFIMLMPRDMGEDGAAEAPVAKPAD